MVSDYWRRDKSRELESAVAVGGDHHCNLNLLVTQSGNTASPFSLDHRSPFKLEPKFDEKRNNFIERLYYDADVVHS
jgi:hypothetical protein